MVRIRSMLLLALAAVSGCLSTSVPIRTVRYARPTPNPEPRPQSDTLIVMLPGLGDSAEDFQSHGFIEQLQRSEVDADIVAVDAHFGYYQRRELLPRLAQDVLGPARAKGYEHIWLVGISLGGFGAMLTAKEYADQIEGLVVISPFLGMPRDVRQIENAGGVARWQPPVEPDNFTEELWAWIKTYQTSPEDRPPLFLAYGDAESRFPHEMLGEVLPPRRVLVGRGEHGWETWKKLWPRILDKRPFESGAPTPLARTSAMAHAEL